MNANARLSLAGAMIIASTGITFARSDVPRSTFGRVPVRPADLSLLTSPEQTPMPATFEDVVQQRRTLPVTAVAARTLKFEHRLTPLEELESLLTKPANSAKVEFVPAPKAPEQPAPNERSPN
jgi:hypothetical protein